MYERQQQLSRWEQHTSHCVKCQQGYAALLKWRRNTYAGLALSLLLARYWPARLVGALCLGLLPAYSFLLQQFKFQDYRHYLQK